jgi:MSHA biogenesis protein MshI
VLLFFKRRGSADALTSLVFCDEGVALARIHRPPTGRPQLTACEFVDGRPAGRALRELAARHGAERARITTLMAPAEYQLLLVEAPDVEPSELRAAMRWRIKDLIDLHIDDAVIDVVEIPGQDRGRARMMYAVAARAPRVRGRVDAIEAADLALAAIDIEELALRNIAALLDEDARGVGLLWLAGDYGQILITRGGELFLARRVEIGANALFSAAQHADPDSGDYGAPLTALLDQLTLELQRSFDYYESHFGQAPVQALTIAPSAPELPFLPAYLGGAQNVPVAPLDLGRAFPDAVLPDPLTLARCLTAIGAALRHEEIGL